MHKARPSGNTTTISARFLTNRICQSRAPRSSAIRTRRASNAKLLKHADVPITELMNRTERYGAHLP